MSNEAELITNIEFDYPFAGKIYKLKRANLRQVIDFQHKIMAMDKSDSSISVMAVAPALLVSLSAVDPTITEDYILDNTPGDIDVMATLQLLGFLSQKKVEIAQKITDSLVKNQTSQPSGEDSLLQ